MWLATAVVPIWLYFDTRNLVEENLELAGTGLALCAFASRRWAAVAVTRAPSQPSPAGPARPGIGSAELAGGHQRAR